MSWEDRQQVARYISPGGATFEFIYEAVSVEVDKKTTEFTFPKVDGSYIQDLGRAGRKYPFTLFFNGEDYDLEATNFLTALEETGIGKLEHPLYGDKSVVPTGTITRNDNLTTGANEASFSVVFSETITDIIYPTDIKGQEKIISDLAQSVQDNSSEEFASSITVNNISEGIALQSLSEASSSFLNNAYSDFVKLNDDINAGFIAISSSFASNSLNVLNDAAGVMGQAILLTRIPSQIETTIEGMVDVYKNTINSLINSVGLPDGSSNPANLFLFNNSLVSGNLAGLCEGILNSEIVNRPQAIEAAEAIVTLYDDSITWRDNNITSLGVVDTNLAYTDLTEVVTTAIIYLIGESFDLPKEIIVILQNDRNVIEFLGTVGLDIETNLDLFIQWNDLTADEIEIMPKDRTVLYYA